MIDYKIVLCGEYGAGKTSLTIRMLRKDFNNYYPSTVGASFMPWKPELINGEQEPQKVTFGIWDTAGQERFGSLLPIYLRDADAVFYCWDSTISFDPYQADIMYDKAKEHSPDCHFYLVHTKIDKVPDFTPSSVAQEWAEEKQLEGYWCTSSLSGEGVQELFEFMAKNLLKNPRPKLSTTAIKVNNETNSTKKCCIH